MSAAKLLQISQIGHPVLRQETTLIENVRGRSVQRLIKDMMYTCADSGGVGIAAPQVYESLQMFIMSSRPLPVFPDAPVMELTAIINPEIVSSSSEQILGWEACLSIPGIRGLVSRPTSIEVRFTNNKGSVEEHLFEGFVARVFMHEYDHLIGRLITDHADQSSYKSDKEFQKMVSLLPKK